MAIAATLIVSLAASASRRPASRGLPPACRLAGGHKV